MLVEEKKLDPRQKRTRRLIQDAFLELVEEKALETITVQDITERATVNRATFYHHFEDKYALMEFCFRDSFHQLLMKNSLPNSPCTLGNLENLITTACEFLREFQGKCNPASKGHERHFETQITSQLYEILLHWLSEEQVEEAAAAMQASVTSWAIYGAAVHWKRVHRQMTLEAYVGQVKRMILACMNSTRLSVS